MAEIHDTSRENRPVSEQGLSELGENPWDEVLADRDPRAPRWYDERQFDRCPHYRGFLRSEAEDAVLDLLREAINYFSMEGYEGMPLPPEGLPGALNRGYSPDSPEAELIAIGYEYFICAVRGESRAMHNRWKAANRMIYQLERAACDKLIEAQVAQEQKRASEMSRDRDRLVSVQRVYFIAAKDGPIKIGMAANPKQRCKDLQTSHHAKLSVLATCGGGREQERAYHMQFAKHRLKGEWFARVPEILAEIARLKA